MDSVDVAVTMPDRQLEDLLQMDDDEDADQKTAIKIFNLEAVAGKIFNCKKKSVGEFDEDVDDKGADNPLAVLEVELDAEDEVNSENMADWLKKLHMRTQHLVGKVTVNGMSRLAATNNVATALTRFKGKARVDNSGNRASSDGNSNGDNNSAEEGQSTFPELPTTPTGISKDVPTEKENPSKESVAVRSKKEMKPSSKTKTARRKETSPSISSSGTKALTSSSEIRKTVRTKSHPTAINSLPAPARTAAVVSSLKTNKVKAIKISVRSSGIKSKVH
ncbi:uncharacterized protein LOC124342807 [Daphnia pulicaria]|uniref:uncharacterized protein LOC124342807 n=1 Tax=Daphnia pulicaria TaxID=35523 RepID=UPI001EEB1683|nr:uncharacterized protein LOC124342807 [Daphnia pulicaria]